MHAGRDTTTQAVRESREHSTAPQRAEGHRPDRGFLFQIEDGWSRDGERRCRCRREQRYPSGWLNGAAQTGNFTASADGGSSFGLMHGMRCEGKYVVYPRFKMYGVVGTTDMF